MNSARIITNDHHALNRALINGDIDFYISGGAYTASAARLAGCIEVTAVTPEYGPIDGKGGVAFVEINALIVSRYLERDAGQKFLEFIESDDGALAASLAAGACNPSPKCIALPSSSGAISSWQCNGMISSTTC